MNLLAFHLAKDYPVINYFDVAKQHEIVFRGILNDLEGYRLHRPRGEFIPVRLDTHSPIEHIYELYSTGDREGKFTICAFELVSPAVAQFVFKTCSEKRGGGALLEYFLDKSVNPQYRGSLMAFSYDHA